MQKKLTLTMMPSSIDKFKYKCSQFFLGLCFFIFVVVLFFNVTYSVAPVSGYSMLPTLNENFVAGKENSQDRVVLNYIAGYKKGDIIVAKKQYNDGDDYIYVIKRLIAIGGDTVEVKPNGDVYVNGKYLEENYTTNTKSATYSKMQNLKSIKPELFTGNVLNVPKNYVFYLGDNRAGSSDCSDYGPVKKGNVIARVDFVIKSGENFYLSILKQIFN
ncbi:MAG: signal peptidase I [Clostridiales bacterium]|nr:signal peptidase I [Clostridiales bacterium]